VAENRPLSAAQKIKNKRAEGRGVATRSSEMVAEPCYKGRGFIDIDHNLKQNNQTIKILRDDRPIG
jgi:hypothetical protein